MRKILLFSLLCFAVFSQSVLIKGGTYVPLYGPVEKLITVKDFYIDQFPVTNAQYLDFVKENPKWQRSKVLRLFADKNYLRHWQNDTTLAAEAKRNAPVTNVSWFAAKAYAKSKGMRLPTMDEWEYIAMADETRVDARKDSLFNKYILSWYEKPKTFGNEIGQTFKNVHGVYDMHGLVWEWLHDFNSVLISGESRQDVDSNKKLFCAGGSVGANDLMNYAAFMRYAFRGSIKANYSIQNLGFRCAKDVK